MRDGGESLVVLDRYNVKIKVALDSGIYVFENYCATGKTRLYKELKRNQIYGENVIAYTYDDIRLGIDFPILLKGRNHSVIVFDRYDLYNGLYLKDLQSFSNSVILVDCKGEIKVGIEYKMCYIEMHPDEIEVLE